MIHALIPEFHVRFRAFLFGLALAGGIADVSWLWAIPLIAALYWSYWHEDRVKRN